MWKNLLEGQFSLVDWWKNSSANYAALLNLKEYSERWKPFSSLCGKAWKGSEAMSIRGVPRQLCASWDTGSGCAQRKLWAQAYGTFGENSQGCEGWGKVEFPLGFWAFSFISFPSKERWRRWIWTQLQWYSGVPLDAYDYTLVLVYGGGRAS